ncbi:glutamate synthase subunit beta [Methylococcus capsulatus]|jgi:glutamate synthase (NADPH/NADH) small chain|uniref:Glutamate synthase [NADPH] small chain n=1 Tax=Methylococcus capsulatus TaxID=414 RepID=A0AA35URU2_METCP|nr:glutamate synthase subunit beta [Methylococcus capsulatus]QXP87339.1 glutamate synthase subunit beta [Methylococcus capsulatus]QXP91306.1 glutamate synthase subunit beta [Methylococcus capsulatus]QXP92920.1 glutamate synthase subunit beta [Methylococcus capsulatus]UQN12339.1 glutamate synthase subunit beta [Methylococcus capsulatus]CAI8854812.1 Glutamate synthase [NADPH] small chain [Methylococcus capsulatus]
MGKPTGFMEIARQDRRYTLVADRIQHYREFIVPLSDEEVSRQGARCMDCGIPYCHQGCPINNIIPDWNDLVYQGDWEEALEVLHSTNNFPEFTGRICPAPCEAACTLNLNDEPVTIKTIECAIADKAWEENRIRPQIPSRRTDKRVAVVGSGPAGLACAQQLARAGHGVVVYEKADRIGGLLRYGIPDFKMEKHLIDRRIAQMQAEGVIFRPNSHIGANIPLSRLMAEFDAIVLAGGSEKPRDLPVPGRELAGIHFAMEFLKQQNRRVAGDTIDEAEGILATDKHVIVIGGGDTGSDCIGTSVRQGAASVVQLEILPQPPAKEDKSLTWPNWPNRLRTSSSQEEGCERHWSIATKRFSGENGKVTAIHCIKVNWKQEGGRWVMEEIPGTEFTLQADLVLLAMGFVHPVQEGLLQETGVRLDERGNVQADTRNYRTSVDKIFAAGDMRRGQSLVVWAIREGRQAARAVDEFLMGRSDLPR